MTLPPHNEYARCLKCGNRRGPETKPVFRYCSHLAAPQCELGLVPAPAGEEVVEWEHQHRTCTRCGYQWGEACLTPDEQIAIARQNLLDAGVDETEISEDS